MARVLMTGFEPFRHWQVNSSWEAVRLLGGRLRDVAVACLPVEHHAAAQAVRELIAREGPEVVLLAGLAPDPVLRLETVARPGPLAPWAGGVRRGRWGWPDALGALRSAGLPVRVSRDAGRYVCDTTYWAALGEGPRRVAFMHLPPPGPVWTAERAARALSAALAGAGLRER